MENPDRKIELTKQEKRSSLKAQFWNDKQEIDKNTPLMRKIEKICKNIGGNFRRFYEKKSN